MPQSLPRKVYCQPLAGYRHMYRSLLRFFPITPQEALSLLYALYIGNLDTCHFAGVPPQVTELTADGFCSLVCAYARPYHTEVQMYRSMHALLHSIRYESIYDCGITDARTTYALCWGRLTVRQEEPLTALRE